MIVVFIVLPLLSSEAAAFSPGGLTVIFTAELLSLCSTARICSERRQLRRAAPAVLEARERERVRTRAVKSHSAGGSSHLKALREA